jgi:hypothetical protein
MAEINKTIQVNAERNGLGVMFMMVLKSIMKTSPCGFESRRYGSLLKQVLYRYPVPATVIRNL